MLTLFTLREIKLQTSHFPFHLAPLVLRAKPLPEQPRIVQPHPFNSALHAPYKQCKIYQPQPHTQLKLSPCPYHQNQPPPSPQNPTTSLTSSFSNILELFSPTPTNSTSKNKWPSPSPLPQRSPRVRRRHNLCNYTSLVSMSRNFEVRSSVGAHTSTAFLIYRLAKTGLVANGCFATNCCTLVVSYQGLSLKFIQGVGGRALQHYSSSSMPPLKEAQSLASVERSALMFFGKKTYLAGLQCAEECQINMQFSIKDA